MTTENTNKQIEDAPKTSAIVEIQKQIKTDLVEQNPSVREKYIEIEVNKKISERVELVKKAINLIAETQKELQKIKPDQVLYGSDGKVAQELYSKDVTDKRNKAEEKLGKLEKAIAKAFDSADYGDLENLCK